SELPRHESGTGPVFAIQPSYCFRKTGPSAGMLRTAAVLALSWPRVPHPPQISARQPIAPKRKIDVFIRTSWTLHKMWTNRQWRSKLWSRVQPAFGFRKIVKLSATRTRAEARDYTSECQLDAELHVACGSGAGDASEIRC